MRAAKQIVFRYNGDPTTEESDLDMDGDKSVPEPGSFAVPIYRVFLANEL
jgi:hypothetical protein